MLKQRLQIEEIKQKQRLIGFNSIFAVSSVSAAKLYYDEFRKQIKKDPTRALKVAVIYSYTTNEEESEDFLEEENPEDTSALDQSARDFLDSAIQDYNLMFHTNYDTSSDKFQNYYRDVSLRMKICNRLLQRRSSNQKRQEPLSRMHFVEVR